MNSERMSTADSIKEKRSKLSPAKQALLEQRLRGRTDGSPGAKTIPRRQQQNFVPLSFAQLRLWFLDQLQPGSPFYNVSRHVRISGALDYAALQRALNELVARHESLRTTFGAVANEPVQIIHEPHDLPMPLVDLSNLAADEREKALARLSVEHSETPFSLTEGPLITVKLVRLSSEDHNLFLSLHHIVTDAWSTALLLRELIKLYEAFLSNQPSPLDELPIQYADFAIWQREFLKGETLNKQLSYWKQQLADAPVLLELPLDRPRPPAQTFRGAFESVTLPENLTSALKDFSRREGATLFMTLLAAFQTLLWRHTQQDDILVGAPIANRTRKETESLIGFFVNTLVMRSRITANLTFRELLREVKETTLAAYSHQDLPFEKLVEELQPERSLSHNPLFQVTLALQNIPQTLGLGKFTIDPMGVDGSTTRLDLEAYVWDLPEGLVCEFVYSTDLFNQDTIKRLLRRFEVLLEDIPKNPNGRVSELALLIPEERQQLLALSRGRIAEPRTEDCIQDLFEQQVEQSRERTALCFDQERLSYRELNARANRLAHYLIKRGAGPETLVGVCLERSLELVVALLGILKSGAAYVPLDPAYPPERLALIASDAGVSLIVTQETLQHCAARSEVETICLDSRRDNIARESEQNPKVALDSDNPAYVIYTSGSTGAPKGVVVTHQNVVRLMKTTEGLFHFDSNDVWTLFHSYAFDFSVWEMWGALFYGGRLVIVPYLVSRAPEDFCELLCREQVTVLNQTPSAFRQLVEAEAKSTAIDRLWLREVIFGGEALDFQSIAPWFARHGDTRPRLVNMYGITETTVHVTYRPLARADVNTRAGSLIGRPLGDLRVHILDRAQQLAPIGVPGEMYVGGRGVARGYLSRPELTAERFVPDPFSVEPGARLYRTGDLARYLASGDIEYLGRVDRQVKVRGFRIELGEIESVLANHEMVRDCLVLARQESGDQQLIAYVVAKDQSLSMESARSFLKDRLPPYMVPSSFVLLDQFPLTPNGKIDERALPQPEKSRPDLADAFVAPRTETETKLASLWRDVLGRDEIGVHDNFFDLGGHSLLATQVIARIRETFNANLPLRYFFEQPTVAGLADFLRDAKVDKRELMPEIKRLPRA
jgi:amino acid adenylation domain-containing protein